MTNTPKKRGRKKVPSADELNAYSQLLSGILSQLGGILVLFPNPNLIAAHSLVESAWRQHKASIESAGMTSTS
jgi:hypothetical protein